MKKQQIQKQEQLSAYDRKTTFDIFHMTMEWLEKYIEVAGYYSDWNNRKQIRNNNINRKDIVGNPEKAEKSFSTQLFLFKVNLDDDPPFLRDEIKQEFYRWLNATKIDANNCPEKLKQWLFGVNEILEGRGEKIQLDAENRQQTLDSGSPEYMEQMNKVFAHIQGPMQGEKETKQSLAGKTHKDIKIESKFGSGIAEQGEQAFQRIAGTVSTSHEGGFHFFPQQGQLTNSQQRTNSEIIQNIRQNPRNWRIDEIITEFDNFGRTNQETVLIHQSARLNDYDQRTGRLNLVNNPIYQASRFNSQEIAEIQQVLNISQQQSTLVQQPPYKWSWQ